MVSSYAEAAVMDKVVGPILFFLGGMVVGSTLVAIAWYIAHIRYYKPKQDGSESQKMQDAEQRDLRDQFKVKFAEIDEVEELDMDLDMNDSCGGVLVEPTKGDYLLSASNPAVTDSDDPSDPKSQIVSIVDFRAVPRNEAARQQARRELVIQMLIAESMTN